MTVSLMLPLTLTLTATSPGDQHAALLAEHRAVCAHLESVEAVRSDALGRGWTAVPDNGGSRLANILAEARGAKGATVLGAVVDKAYLFEREIAGRRVGMIVLDEHFPQSDRLQRARICRHYDVGAQNMVSGPEGRAWVGRKPDSAGSDDVPRLTWAPGLFGPKSITDITFDAGSGLNEPGLTVSSSIEDWNGKWPY